MKKKKIDPIEQEVNYVNFLKKKIESKNYKANASSEEFEETKKKYEKAKFKLKMMKDKK